MELLNVIINILSIDILLMISLYILLCAIILYYVCDKKETMIDLPYTSTSWSRNKCKYMVNPTIKSQIEKYGIEQDDNGWNLFLPCSYSNCNDEIKKMPVIKNAKYFIIDNVDSLVAKESLWKGLIKYYGIEKACEFVPRSYVVSSTDDMHRLMSDYKNNKLYIMKKNLQQQKGLKITNNLNDILNAKQENFKIIQELLQNPYLINGHKINLRCYVLVICKNKEINVYVYDDGFMYYTKKPFKENDIDMDKNITTGYIDRKIYDMNPLTHKNFKNFLDDKKRKLSGVEKNLYLSTGENISEICFRRIKELIRNVYIAFATKICNSEKFKDNTMFQLFGVDIALDNALYPMIMEINKGPDLSIKDEKDGILKKNMVDDMLRIVGSIDNNKFTRKNGFEIILDVTKN